MSPSGAPTPPPVRCGYPKEARLRVAKDFQPVRSRGLRSIGKVSVIRLLESAKGRARLGIATPRAYGGAVERNRFRRLAREAFRASAAALGSVDCFVEPRKDRAVPTLRGLTEDLLAAIRGAR